jgi:hypothetical protein
MHFTLDRRPDVKGQNGSRINHTLSRHEASWAVKIHAKSNKILGKDTLRYSTITRCLRKHSFLDSSELAEEETEIGSSEPIDRAIRQALNEQLFVSLQQIAKKILISLTTI